MKNIFKFHEFPDAVDPTKVGSYPLETFSGGGYFYDDVLEYRVWAKEDGELNCYSFVRYDDAHKFSRSNKNAEPPLVLVRQLEYIGELHEGDFKHIKEERITEWQTEWLRGNRGTAAQIPQFLKDNVK